MKNVIKAIVATSAIAVASIGNAGVIEDQINLAFTNSTGDGNSRTAVSRPSTFDRYLGSDATNPVFRVETFNVQTITGFNPTTFQPITTTTSRREAVRNATNADQLERQVRAAFYGTQTATFAGVPRPTLTNITYTGSETSVRCAASGGTGCYDASNRGIMGDYYAQIEADIHTVNWIASRTTFATLTDDRADIQGILQTFSMRAARIITMNNAVNAALADIATPDFDS